MISRPDIPSFPPVSAHRRQRRPQQGIALMLVLWVLALLTVIAIAMTSAQRTESALTANQLADARFRALADAGIYFAAINLTARVPAELAQGDQDTGDLWIPDGRSNDWSFQGERLEISIFDEASLINLNQASGELLTGLLNAVGVPEEEQAALVDAILDWRDTDDLHLLNGAEDPDYESAGRPYGAKDGPFHSVEELAQVVGFDAQLFRSLAPALTVAAGAGRTETSGGIDTGLDLSPALVRAAIEGIGLEEVEERLAEEAAADVVGDEVSSLERGGPLYRIRIDLESTAGAARSMVAVVRIQDSATPPVAILWRRFALRREPDSPEGDGQADE